MNGYPDTLAGWLVWLALALVILAVVLTVTSLVGMGTLHVDFNRSAEELYVCNDEGCPAWRRLHADHVVGVPGCVNGVVIIDRGRQVAGPPTEGWWSES